MSLIFEALKKLERERDVTERGFQVIAPAPWPARSRAARVALLSVAAAALGAAGAWATWTFLSSRGTAPAPVAAVQPSARPLPPPIWDSPQPAAVAPAAPLSSFPVPPRAATSTPPTVAVAAPVPAPAGAPAQSEPAAFRLEAISARDGEPVAVINGQLVRKGDTVEGAVVTWIGVDSVELEVDGKRRVLTF